MSVSEMTSDMTLIIIPTYNEALNIAEAIEGVWRHAPGAHILVVDDNSRDGTRDIVLKIKQDHDQKVHLLERAGKLGLGTAYIAGFHWALARGYAIIIEMDADLSHDPSLVPKMVERLASECDVAIGSRYIAGGGTVNWGLGRRLISRGGSLYARTILRMKVRDLTGGFNAWNRVVLETIDLDQVKSEGYSFQIELKYRAARLGFRLMELPIIFADRRAGQSKMSGKIVVEAMLRVWLLALARLPSKKVPGERV